MKGEQLSRMLVLATNRHDGQFDKGGNPYILHPLKVWWAWGGGQCAAAGQLCRF